MWRVELLASMTVLVAVITRVALDRESGGIHLLKQQFWGEESTHRMKMYPPATRFVSAAVDFPAASWIHLNRGMCPFRRVFQ